MEEEGGEARGGGGGYEEAVSEAGWVFLDVIWWMFLLQFCCTVVLLHGCFVARFCCTL